MTEWHFYEKVYRRWVILVIGTLDEFKNYLKDLKYREVDELYDAKGMCVELNTTNNDSGQYLTIVWLKQFESATLVHELSHLVMLQFDQVGIPISRDNTESFAFYLEYWFAEMNRVRRRFPKGRKPSEVK